GADERLVVAAPAVGVGECFVGGLEFPEVLGRTRRDIRVVELGEASIRALDGRGARIAGHAEDAVIVLALFHSHYTIGRGPKDCQAKAEPSAVSIDWGLVHERPQGKGSAGKNGR